MATPLLSLACLHTEYSPSGGRQGDGCILSCQDHDPGREIIPGRNWQSMPPPTHGAMEWRTKRFILPAPAHVHKHRVRVTLRRMVPPCVGGAIQWTLSCALLAALIGALCTYNERVVVHTDRVHQHAMLLDSEICTDATLRVATSEVNGCDTAHRVVAAFSPRMHAMVDLLEVMSPCGAHAGRCERLVATIWENAYRALFVSFLLLFSLAWLFLKKHEIDTCTASRLPLDSGENPLIPFYCKKRD